MLKTDPRKYVPYSNCNHFCKNQDHDCKNAPNSASTNDAYLEERLLSLFYAKRRRRKSLHKDLEGPFEGVSRGFDGTFQGSGGSCQPYLELGHLLSHLTTPDMSQIFNLVKSLIHFIQEASKLFFFSQGAGLASAEKGVWGRKGGKSWHGSTGT